MTSIIKLEALSGVQDDGPVCYLLQVDQFHFLLDCGWDETFDMAYIEALRRRVPIIDAVLITYADVPHLGALPYLVGKCGLKCPIYATVPVYKMGQMFLYDWFISHNNVEEFSLFSLDDIDETFKLFQQLKYTQQVSLKGKGHGLQITPIPAGHMIGGTLWKITKMGEEEIVYAVDFNHKKERHLNGCTFEGIGTRPNLLITDAFNAQYVQARRKQRDEELVSNILRTLRSGGDVLLVIDTAGRVLELAHLLDQLWHNTDAGLITYNLVVMNNVAYTVNEFAKSQVEWMSDKILRAFEDGRYNPFEFRHVKLCHSHAELNRVRSPKVVLTSHPDMECGFSRELFLEWCADSKNSVIVTSRSGIKTLGSKLIHIAQGGEEVSRHLTLEIKRRIRLEGMELEAHWRRKRENEQEAARLRLESQRRSTRVETVESSDDSDGEDIAVVGADDRLQDRPYDVMWKFEQQQKASFFKQNKRAFPMYPYIEEKPKWDDYGEIIRLEDYTIADSIVPAAIGGGFLAFDNARRDSTFSTDAGDGDTPGGGGAAGQMDVPSKCITSVTKLEVLCKVAFIEFEGRSDGESIKKILSQIKPKQLILVHGSAEATRHLAEHCENAGIAAGRTFTPRLGEVVEATIESHIFQVSLSDALMSQVEFQPVKDAELSWVDARLIRRNALAVDAATPALGDGHMKMELPDTVPTTSANGEQLYGSAEQMETAGAPLSQSPSLEIDMEQSFGLETLPLNSIPPHTAVFVNDPKLSDLKQLLMHNGLQAEFSAGVLYVNNLVSIRRNEAGRFHFEGSVCDDFYRIRDLIYRQYAIV